MFSGVLNVHLRFLKGEVNREGEEPKVERLVGCLGIQPGEVRFVMLDLCRKLRSCPITYILELLWNQT